MTDPSSGELAAGRLARLRRAEALLDRWLDLFEEGLGQARPDPSRTTELANVFAILRRILEIEQHALKLAALQESLHGADRCPLDPALFGEGIPGDPGEE